MRPLVEQPLHVVPLIPLWPTPHTARAWYAFTQVSVKLEHFHLSNKLNDVCVVRHHWHEPHAQSDDMPAVQRHVELRPSGNDACLVRFAATVGDESHTPPSIA